MSAKKQRTRTFVIWKGDTQVIGVGIKLRATQTVLEFLAGTAGLTYRDGDNAFLATVPDVEGDQAWLRRNCIGEGDIVGTTSVNDAKERAARCVARYEEKKGDTERSGWGVLKYYLDHFYMRYDMWEDE